MWICFDFFGTSSRDYTYIDDIVSGVIAALDNKKHIKCEVYNLGNSSPVSLNEFIELCEKVVGKKTKYEQIGNQLGDVPHTYADISKAKRDLGYNPMMSLEDGLKKYKIMLFYIYMKFHLGELTKTKIKYLKMLEKIKKENKNIKIIDVGGGKEKHYSNKFNFIDAYIDFRKVSSSNKNLKHYNGNVNDLELWETVFKDVEKNGKYDYCICTHLLEDIAFPQFVCKCINKIAKSGLITFPSKYKELSYFESNKYKGYSHHRWIMTIKNNSILGFPKQGFIESLEFTNISKKCNKDNEELCIFWEDKINFDIINNDWLGPSPQGIINIYLNELPNTDEDKLL